HGDRNLPPGPDARNERMWWPDRCWMRPGIALRLGSDFRGALSARLGRLLVPLGLRVGNPTTPGRSTKRPGHVRDPGGDLADRSSAGGVLPAHHARYLVALRWDCRVPVGGSS